MERLSAVKLGMVSLSTWTAGSSADIQGGFHTTSYGHFMRNLLHLREIEVCVACDEGFGWALIECAQGSKCQRNKATNLVRDELQNHKSKQ